MTNKKQHEDVALASKMQLGKNQQTWIKALRSDKYKQGTGWLKDSFDRYCCLGVACEISKLGKFVMVGERKNSSFVANEGGSKSGETSFLGNSGVGDWLGLNSGDGEAVDDEDFPTLTQLNDQKGYSFKQIADHLEEYPEQYFKESK